MRLTIFFWKKIFQKRKKALKSFWALFSLVLVPAKKQLERKRKSVFLPNW
jgi:hypothetical protein